MNFKGDEFQLKRKIFSGIASIILSFAVVVSVDGYDNILLRPHLENLCSAELSGFNSDDTVTIIVETFGDPVLVGDVATTYGVNYLGTDEGEKKTNKLEINQQKVFSEISETIPYVTAIRFTYTALFNGFSIKAKYKDLEEIRDIAGVKNVYVAEKMNIKPHLNTSVGLTGALTQGVSKYKGEGQIVAVIDTEFDVKHPMFNVDVLNEKYSLTDLENILKSSTLNAKTTAGELYKSEKIPFAYDYCSKKAYVYATENIHGTHVAGIVGGKKVTTSSGRVLSGVAPEVQLALMKVTDTDGSFVADAIIAALEDAAKLGVCAVNCSYGTDYASSSASEVWTTCYENAYNAGIFISASAGNSSKGFYKETPLTKNIDYSAIGLPSALPSTICVAAAENNDAGEVTTLYSKTSYGVSDDLELKPEITAPGGNISSAYPDKKYATASGTSMAAPHITGAVAILNEYLDKIGSEVYGKDRVDLISNLIMSTAEIITQPDGDNAGVPYTPRVQGAGLVNLDAAVKTPVILQGDNKKTKLSLKDGVTETVKIRFTVKNLTDESVTYDNVSADILTDGYTLNTSDNNYYVDGTKRLSVLEDTLPESLTIDAYASVEMSAEIILNSDELSDNLKIYKNGFFIDGFIKLESKNGEIPSVNIPFTGFYGDWTKASVFDATMYDDGGSTLVNIADDICGTFLFVNAGDKYAMTGYDLKSDIYNKNYIALSPNGDGIGDELYINLTPMRTISDFTISIKDINNNIAVDKLVYKGCINKFVNYNLPIGNVEGLIDGEYTLSFEGLHYYNNNTIHSFSLPIYIDTKTPEISGVSVDGTRLSLNVSDNKYIQYIYFSYIDTSGMEKEKIYYVPREKTEIGVTFDIVDLDASRTDEIYIEVCDYALNIYGNTYSCLKGQVVPVMTKFNYLSGMLSTSFNVANKGASLENCSVFLAFYNTDGKLIHTHTQTETITSGNDTLSFNMFADLTDVSTCKMFIWEQSGKLSPLDTDKKFNISSLLE